MLPFMLEFAEGDGLGVGLGLGLGDELGATTAVAVSKSIE